MITEYIFCEGVFMLYVTVVGVLFCLTLKGYCGKRLSCFVRCTEDTCIFNSLRMLFCIFIGIAMVFAEGSQGFLLVEPGMLAVCALSGFSNAAFLIFWMLAIQKNSMVSVDVGLTLGALIPSVLCTLIFGESFSVPKMAGFAMILIATVVLAGGGKKSDKRSPIGILLLSLAAIGDGVTGFSQQLYKHCYTEGGSVAQSYYPKTVFHFYTYVFAALALLAVWLYYHLDGAKKKAAGEIETNKIRSGAVIPLRVAIHIFIMAVCLFAANYLQTVVTNDMGMSSQILYPVLKGGCLITVNFTAMIFFGEKITRRSIIGSLIALCGIITMSIL